MLQWRSEQGCRRRATWSVLHITLTRVIEPKGGPGIELATLEDAARFMGHMRPWRQARPHWDYAAALVLKAAMTGRQNDVAAAIAA